MIKSFKKSIILFTNHELALEIIKRISLTIISTNELNFRLLEIFEYIQRFNVIIKHKSEKQHCLFNDSMISDHVLAYQDT